MKIREAQNKIKHILKGMEHPRLGSFIALTEEVGEVANEIMKKEIYASKNRDEDLKSEIADVFVCLLELSNVYGIDLEKEFQKKLENITPRAEEWKVKFGKALKEKRKKLD